MKTSKRWLPLTFKIALLTLLLLWTLIPITWMVLSSFKPNDIITAGTPHVFFTPTLEHYISLFSSGNSLWPYLLNSLFIAGVSTLIAVVPAVWPASGCRG